jgi:hypothetical protein
MAGFVGAGRGSVGDGAAAVGDAGKVEVGEGAASEGWTTGALVVEGGTIPATVAVLGRSSESAMAGQVG